MKLPVVAIIAAGLIILAVIITTLYMDNDTRGEDKVDKEVKIPAIDAARPDVTETATFALG